MMRTTAVLAALMVLTAAAGGGAAVAADSGRCEWSCSPDAAWLRKVLARAGYWDVGATGSALETVTAARKQRYFWTTPASSSSARGLPEVNRVAGVRVYSDGVKQAWRAQGRLVWVHAPLANVALAELVRASLSISAPRIVDRVRK